MESSLFPSSPSLPSSHAMATANGYEGYKAVYEDEISLLRNTIENVKKDNEKQTKRVSKMAVLAELKDMELQSMRLDLEKLQKENITLKALVQRWEELREPRGIVAEEDDSAPGSTTDSGIAGDFADTEKHRPGNDGNFSCGPLDNLNQIKPDMLEESLTNSNAITTNRLKLGTSQIKGKSLLLIIYTPPPRETMWWPFLDGLWF